MKRIFITLLSLFFFTCSALYDKTEFGNYVYKGNNPYGNYGILSLDDEFEGYKKTYQEHNWSLVDLNGSVFPHQSLNLVLYDYYDVEKDDVLYLKIHRIGFDWMFIKSLVVKPQFIHCLEVKSL